MSLTPILAFIVSSCDKCAKQIESKAPTFFLMKLKGGALSKDLINLFTELKFRSVFLHHKFLSGKKEWVSICSIVSSSNFKLSSMTPKVPFLLLRPALPAI